MKVTNWRKKLAIAIAAMGIWIPSVAHAVNIPLADPSFEAFAVPAAGYAYANSYRPTSGWVDDLDHSSGAYIQDNAASNWLYNTAYGEDGPPFRGAPRTGNQAMHGFYKYSAQEVVDTFQAGITYTFSLWAQGDNNAVAGGASTAYLYLFDGTIPFLETGPGTAVVQSFFSGAGGQFANRGTTMTQSQSQANWTQISTSYTVAPGSPLIGHPIGVAFYLGEDISVDDATLTAVPEPTTVLLVSMGGLALLTGRRRRS